MSEDNILLGEQNKELQKALDDYETQKLQWDTNIRSLERRLKRERNSKKEIAAELYEMEERITQI